MTISLNELYQRDLDKSIEELNLYENEEDIWKIRGDIKNSAGTLALHMAGNLQHFIGAHLGNTGYVRDRDNEFAARGLSRAELITELEKAKQVLNDVLPTLSEETLKGEWPEKNPFDFNVEQFLLHLYGHLNWHRGHLNYHRRML